MSNSAGSHSNRRFERALRRVGAEAFWLKTYHTAISQMKVHALGLDFFRVSLNSLKDARLLRLARVLEDSSRTASFWYLEKCNSKLVGEASKKAPLDLALARSLSTRLRPIRNKTLMHIDKAGVFDPDSLYKAAGITHAEVEHVILGLWRVAGILHMKLLGEELLGDDYSGQDIVWLADLRDAALAT